MDRRGFLHMLAAAGTLLTTGGCASARRTASAPDASLYDVPVFGNARLLHITDVHAQLKPVYYREPGVNLGIGEAYGKVPHLVGHALLAQAGLKPGGIEAHAFTHLDFREAAVRYGRVGGFACLATLINRLRAETGRDRSLLLDGGDTWQGSGTAYWTRGKDMVGACNRLGVDVMTGHWEFTYLEQEILENLGEFAGEFVAQNIRVSEDALFEGVAAFDEDTGHAFRPYTIRSLGDRRVAVVGQAFPYTPIANPARFIPNWEFGIRAEELQSLVEAIREKERPDAVVLLSHNGMDVDLKLAAIGSGIDAILGGHTHDGVPVPVIVKNRDGRTVVTNAGSNGKFVGVLDLDLAEGRVRDFRYRLLPVFANLLEPDAAMSAYVDEVRAPYAGRLGERLAVAGELLYRRGNFNGSFDQVICDALREVGGAQIALSPGFRWGTTVLPGEWITMENVLDQTCITETYVEDMPGEQIKLILEDVCDNLFNPDPFYQQGGDMVRVGGLDYSCDPTAAMGSRITDLRLDDGTPIEAGRSYKVAGWARVGSQSPGPPIWDVVAEYLRTAGEVRVRRLNTPRLLNVAGNPGIET
jgi:sulfur-oxidizing protein SoxB